MQGSLRSLLLEDIEESLIDHVMWRVELLGVATRQVLKKCITLTLKMENKKITITIHRAFKMIFTSHIG